MATAGDVTFSGQINGCTDQGGQVGPIDIAYLLKNQRYVAEIKDLPISAAAALPGSPVTANLASIPAGLAQTLFLIKASLAVDFTINAGVTTYSISKPGGVFVMSPGITVTSVEFGNPGGSEAKVYILQVVGSP